MPSIRKPRSPTQLAFTRTTRPDDTPRIGGMRASRAAQLALVVVIVNVAACLIASRAMTLAEQASMAATQDASRPVAAATDDSETTRSPPLSLAPMIKQSRMPARSDTARSP